MNINKRLTMRDWPSSERPYEKLLMAGAGSLTNAEIIAILLASGMQGYTSVELAKKLLNSCNSIRELQDLTVEELQQVPGIGQVKAARLQAAIELGKRVVNDFNQNVNCVLNSPNKVAEYLMPLIGYLDHEMFYVIMVDVRKRVIRHKKISIGGLAATVVKPRDIFREAVKSNAGGIILAHNHPSGDPEPSDADIETTNKVAHLGESLGINVIDHVVVASGGYVSLREQGLIKVL